MVHARGGLCVMEMVQTTGFTAKTPSWHPNMRNALASLGDTALASSSTSRVALTVDSWIRAQLSTSSTPASRSAPGLTIIVPSLASQAPVVPSIVAFKLLNVGNMSLMPRMVRAWDSRHAVLSGTVDVSFTVITVFAHGNGRV